MNDVELLDEADNDPASVGYGAAGWSASPPTQAQYQAVADLMNDPAAWSKDRTNVPGHEIFAAIVPTNFLTVFNPDTGDKTHQAYLTVMFGLGNVSLDNPNIRTALIEIFGGMSSTLSAIAALQTVPTARSSERRLGRVRVGDLKRVKGDL